MPKAPDWLLNISASAPDLVEDSPQYRAEEESTQVDNLGKATDEAARQLREQVQQAQLEHIAAMEAAAERIQAQTDIKRQQQLAEQQAQLQHTQEMTKRVQEATAQKKQEQLVGLEQQKNQVMDQTQQLDSVALEAPGTPPPGFYPGEDTSTPMDPSQAVLQLSKNLGLSPQVVASMVIIGEDLDRLDREGKLQKETPPWHAEAQAAEQQALAPIASPTPGPVPLAGPPAVATPGTAPVVPQPEPQPMPMVPPGEPTPY